MRTSSSRTPKNRGANVRMHDYDIHIKRECPMNGHEDNKVSLMMRVY